MRIFKYTLEVKDEQHIDMPYGAKLLCIQMQDGKPQLWAMVDPDRAQESRNIRTYGTGHLMPKYPGEYIGTYQMHGGGLVFHVFDDTYQTVEG